MSIVSTSRHRLRSHATRAAICLTAGVGYGAAYALLIVMARLLGASPAMWPVNAMAIVYLLTERQPSPWKWAFVFALFLGATITSRVMALGLVPSAVFGLAQVLPVAGAIVFFPWFSKGRPEVHSVGGLLRFIIPTSILAAIPGAVAGALAEAIWSGANFLNIFAFWFTISALSVMVCSVFLLSVRRDLLASAKTASRLAELGAVAASFVHNTPR